MPQVRLCPNCKKLLQVNEIHNCPGSMHEYQICHKCGKKYNKSLGHICPTMI